MKAEWIRHGIDTIRCSNCKGEPYWSSKEGYYPYCPYCGKRMENALTMEERLIKKINALQKELEYMRGEE